MIVQDEADYPRFYWYSRAEQRGWLHYRIRFAGAHPELLFAFGWVYSSHTTEQSVARTGHPRVSQAEALSLLGPRALEPAYASV